MNATWGLGAISSAALIDPSASLRDGFEYRYDADGGAGTFAYVIDTGVWVDNPDFEGRAELGYTVYPEIPFEDSTGHGTHVAGTIASKTWGVAKKARVIAVKVIAPGQVIAYNPCRPVCLAAVLTEDACRELCPISWTAFHGR